MTNESGCVVSYGLRSNAIFLPLLNAFVPRLIVEMVLV